MNNVTELKPCPFCSGKPILYDTECGGQYIECDTCQASTNIQYSVKEDGLPLLTERWNNRRLATTSDVTREILLDMPFEDLARILYEEYDDVELGSDYRNVTEAAFWNGMARRVLPRLTQLLK